MPKKFSKLFRLSKFSLKNFFQQKKISSGDGNRTRDRRWMLVNGDVANIHRRSRVRAPSGEQIFLPGKIFIEKIFANNAFKIYFKHNFGAWKVVPK